MLATPSIRHLPEANGIPNNQAILIHVPCIVGSRICILPTKRQVFQAAGLNGICNTQVPFPLSAFSCEARHLSMITFGIFS